MKTSKIISLDFEGNGGQPPEIIEVGIANIDNLSSIGLHESWLVKPKDKITWQASKTHQISNRDVGNCPALEKIKPLIYEKLNNSYLIAHNASVEIKLLSKYFPNYNPFGIIDTLVLSKKLLGNKVSSHKLVNLVDYFGLSSEIETMVTTGAHRAEYDAIASGLLFIHFYKFDEEKVKSLIKFNTTKQLSLF